MFYLCAALLGLIPNFAHAQSAIDPANHVFWDCNTSIGPDQQFIIERRNNNLFLKELTMKGIWIERPMSEEEYRKGPIVLTETAGTTSHLWFTPHGLWIESQNSDGSYHQTAEADCN